MPSKDELITPSYIENIRQRIASLENTYNDQHSQSINGDYTKGECHGKVTNCTSQPNPRITPASIVVPTKNSIIVPNVYGTIKEAVNNLESKYSNNCCQSYHCQTCQQECKDVECREIQCNDVQCKDQCDGSGSDVDENDMDTWTPGQSGVYYGNTGPIFIGGVNLAGQGRTVWAPMGNDWVRTHYPPRDFTANDLLELWGKQLKTGIDTRIYASMFEWGGKRYNHYLKYHYNTTPRYRKSRAYNAGPKIEYANQAICEYTMKHPIPYFDAALEPEDPNRYPHDRYKEEPGGNPYHHLETDSNDIPAAIIVYPGPQAIGFAAGSKPALYSKYNDIASGDAYPFWYEFGAIVHNNFDYDAETYPVTEEKGYWYKTSYARLGKLKDIKDKEYTDLKTYGLMLLKWFAECPPDHIDYNDYPYIEGMTEEEARAAFEEEDWRLTLIMFQKNANDSQGMRACCARQALKSNNGIQYAPLSFCVSYWDGEIAHAPRQSGDWFYTPEVGIKSITIPGVPDHIPCGEVIELQESLQNVKDAKGKVTIHMWQDYE